MESPKVTGKNVEVNEYQEALDLLDRLARRINGCFGVRYEEHRKLLQELIDKETPKKPVGEKYNELCPLCYNPSIRSDYASNYELKRCHDCGQVIDWSKNEN